jgi:uncharacterized membrane protein
LASITSMCNLQVTLLSAGTGFIWKSLYNLRTDHTQKTSHAAAIVETYAPIIA